MELKLGAWLGLGTSHGAGTIPACSSFSPFVNCHLAPLPSWGWGYPLLSSFCLYPECFLSLSLYVCFLTPLSSVSVCFSFTFHHFFPPSLHFSVFVLSSVSSLSLPLSLHLSAFTCLSPSLPLCFSLSPPSSVFCSISLSPSLCVSLPLSGPCWPPRHPWH